MADAPVPDLAPAPTPVAAPAPIPAAAPAPEPVVSAAPDPGPAPVPHPADVPSLLDSFKKAEPAAAAPVPAEAPKPGDAPKPEVKAEAPVPGEEPPKPVEVAPAPEPEKVEWKFDLPETLKADEPTLAKFTGTLDELLTPKEGETRPQVARKLLDLHAEKMAEYAAELQRDQIKQFNDTRAEWAKQVLADERIGGAGHQTAMGAIARMRDLSISDHKAGTPAYEKDAKEFDSFLRVTGAGDHPQFLKMLHRFARYFDEPAMPPSNPKPPPNLGQNPNRGKSLYAPRSS